MQTGFAICYSYVGQITNGVTCIIFLRSHSHTTVLYVNSVRAVVMKMHPAVYGEIAILFIRARSEPNRGRDLNRR